MCSIAPFFSRIAILQIAVLSDGDSFGSNPVITATIVCNRTGSEVLAMPVDVFERLVQPNVKKEFSIGEVAQVFKKRCVSNLGVGGGGRG